MNSPLYHVKILFIILMEKIRYYSLNNYFKETFGERVHRIPVDAGFSCPNRDGTKGTGGCIYCDELGSGAGFIKREEEVVEQVGSGIENINKRFNVNKYLVYFQSFTNTYGPLSKLEKLYKSVIDIENVIGISVGTRPDCVDEDVIGILSEIAKTKMVWIEYGLQSTHDKTLELINRGHSYSDFLKAVEITKNKGIKILAHIIVGLPGETREDMMSTSRETARLKLDGLKIHSLYIVKGTELEKMYNQKKFKLLTEDEYIQIAADILEILPPNMVIHRLVGECDRERLVAPDWSLKKNQILNGINSELKRRGTKQGSRYKN
ncbi:TIGR01212 family radical SAM protein [candidate division KSB1 bacterium]